MKQIRAKVRASLHSDSLTRIEADIEALVQAEGLAMPPGPRPSFDEDLLARLREAITICRITQHWLNLVFSFAATDIPYCNSHEQPILAGR